MYICYMGSNVFSFPSVTLENCSNTAGNRLITAIYLVLFEANREVYTGIYIREAWS